MIRSTFLRKVGCPALLSDDMASVLRLAQTCTILSSTSARWTGILDTAYRFQVPPPPKKVSYYFKKVNPMNLMW